jgi:phosphoadenosine phosphosulfate reductase
MPMSVAQKTVADLTALADKVPSILVSYSGGKDSLAVMELCTKVFGPGRVKAFFWFTVPDPEVCNQQLQLCRDRWGIDPVQIPHWDMVMCMKKGLWCDQKPGMEKLPDIDLKTGYAYAMEVCGAQVCATGMKDADGLPRRHFFANIRDGGNPFWNRLVHPIREWNKRDVLDYLKANGIPIPEAEPGAVTTGVGLVHDALCWLHDKHPNDFQKLLKWYPYAEAAIKRRDWFGVA